MIHHYYCIDCDLHFSVVHTGVEGTVRCPKCHSRSRRKKPKRIYRRVINKATGFESNIIDKEVKKDERK